MFKEYIKVRRQQKDQNALNEIRRQIKKFSSLEVTQTCLLRLLIENCSEDDLYKVSNIAGRAAHMKGRVSL